MSIMQSTGILLTGVIAYFVRDWWKLQLIVGSPILFFASFYWQVTLPDFCVLLPFPPSVRL